MVEMVNLFERLHVGCTLHSFSLTYVITGFLAPLYIPLVGFIYSGEWRRDGWDGPEEGCLRSTHGSLHLVGYCRGRRRSAMTTIRVGSPEVYPDPLPVREIPVLPQIDLPSAVF